MRRAAFVSFILTIFSVSVFAQSAPTVTKVDPPSWWANHTINPIRLLVRGKNLSGARVRSGNARLTVTNPGQSANYLFLDLHISPGTQPGKYALLLETKAGTAEVPFTIEAGFHTGKDFQGINNDDVIYLIMIDRFADGDRSNNASDDFQNARSYHGGDLRGIIDRLPYLKDLGVTALWLTP